MILLFCLFFLGQETEQPTIAKEKYQNMIDIYEKYSNNIFEKDFRQKIEIIDKKTKEKKSFTTLNQLEQHTFILSFSQQILIEASKTQHHWIEEIKKFDNPNYNTSDPNVAKKDDIVKYSKELVKIRKKLYGQFESYLLKMLKDFDAQITDSEKKILIRKTKELIVLEN